MNCLRTLLNRLVDAASYWLQTPFDAADELWLNQPPRDGADRLAEREAEEEVSEPAPVNLLDYPAFHEDIPDVSGFEWRDDPDPLSDEERFRLQPGDGEGVLRDALFCLECGDVDTARHQIGRVIELLDRTTTSAAPGIRSSVDAADGPRGTAAQPETRAGHPNPQ